MRASPCPVFVTGTRESALRLGLVTRAEMVAALAAAVASTPTHGTRVVTVPEIRRAVRQRPASVAGAAR